MHPQILTLFRLHERTSAGFLERLTVEMGLENAQDSEDREKGAWCLQMVGTEEQGQVVGRRASL